MLLLCSLGAVATAIFFTRTSESERENDARLSSYYDLAHTQTELLLATQREYAVSVAARNVLGGSRPIHNESYQVEERLLSTRQIIDQIQASQEKRLHERRYKMTLGLSIAGTCLLCCVVLYSQRA